MSIKNPSAFQTAIFNWIATESAQKAPGRSGKHLVIDAKAGTGKTTTMVEALRHILPGQTVLFCAFNKSIADELARKVPGNTVVKTLHGLGLTGASKAFGKLRVNNDKGKNILNSILPQDMSFENRGSMAKLVSMGKCYLATTPAEMIALANKFDCMPDAERDGFRHSEESWASWALQAMKAALRPSSEISFDDMVYVPAALNISCGSFDWVIVDECQDMNASQLALAMGAVSKTGSIVVVGDPNQAIYGWRGADSDAMGRMTDRLSATVLPLSITYRCPKSVVAMAQEYVPAYLAADSAPEGTIVEGITEEKFREGVLAGDFVLSRTNAPLARMCLAALSDGKRAYIQGRDIGAGLKLIVKKSGKSTIKEFLNWLDTWEQETIEALERSKQEKKIDETRDKVEVLMVLSEGCKTSNELMNRIEGLFDDSAPAGRIMFSSVHRAKGLEAHRVWVFENTFFLPKGNIQEEKNLWYVAITRTKESLFMVSLDSKRKR